MPTNPPPEVTAVLSALGITDAIADGPLGEFFGGKLAEAPAHLARAASARDALATCVDIGTTSTWPTLPLLRLLSANSRRAPGEMMPATAALVAAAVVTPPTAEARAAHAKLQARSRPDPGPISPVDHVSDVSAISRRYLGDISAGAPPFAARSPV